jgi:putative transposase
LGTRAKLVKNRSCIIGRSRYAIYEQQAPHFLTCTINNWIPIFTRPAAVQVILDALSYRQEQRDLKIYAYVILENHLHLIAQSTALAAEISSFKSWTAKRLLDVLKDQKAERILKQLAFYKKAHKIDREYQVWEEGSHPQQILNYEMMLQKIEYIHHNPVKRGYVDNPVHWLNSSARNYAREDGVLNIDTDWFN